jgi:hypothetical protein
MELAKKAMLTLDKVHHAMCNTQFDAPKKTTSGQAE